jgi:hypothetical protein
VVKDEDHDLLGGPQAEEAAAQERAALQIEQVLGQSLHQLGERAVAPRRRQSPEVHLGDGKGDPRLEALELPVGAEDRPQGLVAIHHPLAGGGEGRGREDAG